MLSKEAAKVTRGKKTCSLTLELSSDVTESYSASLKIFPLFVDCLNLFLLQNSIQKKTHNVNLKKDIFANKSQVKITNKPKYRNKKLCFFFTQL